MNVFLPVIVIIFILIIVFRFGRNVFHPAIRGTIGESRVSNRLNKLQGEKYRVINDVLIKTGDRSSQIDHIIISIYGIFVIETKNYSGWIHGNEDAQYWMQTIYKQKKQFYNPIRQNQGHINTLKKILSDYQNITTYHSIIVFTGSAELKNVQTTTPVVYYEEIVDTIRNQSKAYCLSVEQVKNIADRLNKINIHDKDTKKAHINQTRYQIYEQSQKEKSLICPRCNSNLVIRNGQYGTFYGCPNYPKCRYTQCC